MPEKKGSISMLQAVIDAVLAVSRASSTDRERSLAFEDSFT